MATSYQYQFPQMTADLVIQEAYERCGVLDWQRDPLKSESARRSLNFLFYQWMNQGLNLFTVYQGIIPIVIGQNMYPLPPNISKILEAKMVNSNRMLQGTPKSNTLATFDGMGGGSAAIPFNQNPQAGVGCLQTGVNGNISYTYAEKSPQAILYVGIEAAVTMVYELVIECSFLVNPQGAQDWIEVYHIPKTTYYYGNTQWYSFPNTYTAVNWRVRQINGAMPLNLAQIYFNIPYYSLTMNPVGRDLFFGFPTNNQASISTTYWNNRIQNISFDVWSLPLQGYQFFVYNATRYIQDVGNFYNSLDISARFMEVAASGLSYKLAQKWAPERVGDLKSDYMEAFINAGKEDSEDVDKNITYTPREQ